MITEMETVKKDNYRRYCNYLLLNGSFDDNIGLCNGKSALPLLFYYLNTNNGYSFLEEIIEQINDITAVTFGDGIAGFGVVLEHLVQKGFIDEDVNEILADCDKMIVDSINGNNIADVGIESGVTGTGFFLLHRLRTKYPHRNTLFFNQRLKDGLSRCVFAIERAFVAYRLGTVAYPETQTFWAGPNSALLFLIAFRNQGIPTPRLDLIIEDIIRYVSAQLTDATFSWNHIDSWFVLLYSAKRLDDTHYYTSLISAFKKVLQGTAAQFDKLDVHHAAFTAMLLHLIYKDHGIGPALHLSDKVLKIVNKVYAEYSLPDLFPFDRHSNGINVGLNTGVCGITLPLWSLSKNNFQWLSIVGINY